MHHPVARRHPVPRRHRARRHHHMMKNPRAVPTRINAHPENQPPPAVRRIASATAGVKESSNPRDIHSNWRQFLYILAVETHGRASLQMSSKYALQKTQHGAFCARPPPSSSAVSSLRQAVETQNLASPQSSSSLRQPSGVSPDGNSSCGSANFRNSYSFPRAVSPVSDGIPDGILAHCLIYFIIAIIFILI
jgi:hypothetical protein